MAAPRAAAAALCAVLAATVLVSCSHGAPPPVDLRTVDWSAATLPGGFCEIGAPVVFHGGEAEADSARWGRVHLGVAHDAYYGDLDGDGREEAVAVLGCDNGGGTAAGQLAYAAVVLTPDRSGPRVLGTLPPQHRPAEGVHTTLIREVTVLTGRVVVTEQWYGPEDPTCCPGGRGETVWTLQDGRLAPDPAATPG
ncbi:hypothetical protein [Kitasatospora sp. NPDC088346]|uniref:hypothetical protein n=1 Tax=Kitasatospora sp. NPDC088346 TaxID=3364073 RepID=UPI00382D6F6C